MVQFNLLWKTLPRVVRFIQEPSEHSPVTCALGWPSLSREVGLDVPLWSFRTLLILCFSSSLCYSTSEREHKCHATGLLHMMPAKSISFPKAGDGPVSLPH